MDQKERQAYLEQYKKDKEKGVPFFPDILFKDAVAALLVFLALVALALLLGAPLEERADPADTNYTPRPEWYFLFLFQLLKYFPGSLEVIGVVVIPTLAIILLFILPSLDRSSKRHFTSRPLVTGVTALAMVGIIYLTYQSYREAPPPADASGGDPTAALYARNCAGCHGPTIDVPAGTNLHDVIAQGKHEGMPAWSADLSTDQIDALAGFILSPLGSQLFTQNCADCHQASELVASDPRELIDALEQGKSFTAHADQEIGEWSETLVPEGRTALLNFLVAPDGQRLFATNCSPCHGRAVAYAGEESQLKEIISQGGLHLEMPPWQDKFNPYELDTLARYVVDPASVSDGEALFQQYCSACHGDLVPRADEFYAARRVIASGGGHETMPVWGEVLTPEQLDALVSYTLSATEGSALEVGRELFDQNCVSCHGDFGEGGLNPARPNDIIAPISTSEYLKTRDDVTLRAIIAQGQPNFGMSPFGSSFGGPLDDDEIDALVAYMRSWEENPPVEVPPEVAIPTEPALSGEEVYVELCAQCHGENGQGGIGPSLQDPQFHAENTDQEIFDTISEGHAATPMIAWGEILTAEQIQQLVELIRRMESDQAFPQATPTPHTPTFTADVLPIFKAKCNFCHGREGGWDGSNYQSVMTTGDHSPVVIPGDVDNSLLAQKILGTHTEGDIMPPAGKLPDTLINIILDWIAAGAPQD